jgi:hypothetical protein
MTTATTTMSEKTVILTLTINSIGNHRKVKDAKVETASEKSLYNLTKKIMDAPELKKLTSLEGEIRRFVQNLSLPSPFKNGTYTIPISLMMEVDHQLEAFQSKQVEYVIDLIYALPRIESDMRSRQDNLFDMRDFPSSSKVQNSFGVEWGFVQLSTPTSLASVNTALFEREREKIAKQWEDTMFEMQNVLREQMSELVAHMVDRLTPEPNGKKKIFRDTLVTNLTDFLRTFNARNITDNAQLEELANKAASILGGVDADHLRNNNWSRREVRDSFSRIKEQLDTMVIERPTRGIELGD